MDHWDTLETIELDGLKFRVSAQQDDDMTPPWSDLPEEPFIRYSRRTETWPAGSGQPRHIRVSDKASGERVLRATSNGAWLFDVAGATALFREQGCTGAQAAESIANITKHYAAWLHDKWTYMVLCVQLLDVAGNPTDEVEYLGRLESGDDTGIAETATELAKEIASRVGSAPTYTRTIPARTIIYTVRAS